MAPPTQRATRSSTEPRRFSCRQATLAGAVHVAVCGELDVATVPQLDAALILAREATDEVVLDLRELEFIDSSGAHLLVDADRRIRRSSGRLTVVRGVEEVDWLFALLELDRVLELVDAPPANATAAAVEALAAPAP